MNFIEFNITTRQKRDITLIGEKLLDTHPCETCLERKIQITNSFSFVMWNLSIANIVLVCIFSSSRRVFDNDRTQTCVSITKLMFI
ncbi:hypothetical protein NY2A_b017R [Paramecium bursaria Chlorella virus NY2A]|uniref:Uncharacterized protein b017R n=1 Tax=Paramecium bursaria Chlorella virus NY2A TaxID=46021 RepID=A7IVP2_PBCVN|nr:hypothetical protein NY2A_b017R [Paramecium bursaria Chlorella virus NY2A]ABT14416.1 hypothetical protein NY2A_b017R [Paramecium bursaria Chlorella virus NY2A]